MGEKYRIFKCVKCGKEIDKHSGIYAQGKCRRCVGGDINNASHSSRQLAIHTLESIEDELKTNITGELWCDLEDELTDLIEKIKKEI